mmetsp:Transcript_70891/g.218892  ORF Transcript_70891/g.218892 Transcript_70891/m.218892 type:complete len:280 (+) Transcript_70891:148-987(+)
MRGRADGRARTRILRPGALSRSSSRDPRWAAPPGPPPGAAGAARRGRAPRPRREGCGRSRGSTGRPCPVASRRSARRPAGRSATSERQWSAPRRACWPGRTRARGCSRRCPRAWPRGRAPAAADTGGRRSPRRNRRPLSRPSRTATRPRHWGSVRGPARPARRPAARPSSTPPSAASRAPRSPLLCQRPRGASTRSPRRRRRRAGRLRTQTPLPRWPAPGSRAGHADWSSGSSCSPSAACPCSTTSPRRSCGRTAQRPPRSLSRPSAGHHRCHGPPSTS